MSDYLPKDVLLSILVRLPMKPLVQCMCVCKSWYFLITSSTFISTHLNRAIEFNTKNKGNSPLLLIRHYDMFDKLCRYALHFDNESFHEFAELKCPFASENEYFRIVGSCNGLICLSDDYDSHTDRIFIWNPLVRKSIILPKPQSEFRPRGLCLLGFGFDRLRNDYKVVRIVYQSTESYNFMIPPSVELYSINLGTWKSLCDVAPHHVFYNNSPSAPFVNGAVHWVAMPSEDDKDNVGNRIIAFGIGDEVFREVMMPDSVYDKYVIKLSVMVLDESLALVEYEKIWQSDYCWVWVMKEYGVVESWTKVLHIDLRGGIRTVVGFGKHNEVLLSARMIGMASYDSKGKHLNYLGIHGTNRSFYANTFVESLVLLKRLDGVLGQESSSDVICEGPPLLAGEEGIYEQE